MASRIDPSPRTARYSGSDRPAWRMNHTGTRSWGSPRQAARKRGVPGMGFHHGVRRSIDDHPMTADEVPLGDDDEFQRVSWAVAISDDYEDAEVRVVLTVEEVGRSGAGL